MKSETKKYITVFFITLGIFIVVFGLVNYLNKEKLADIDDLQRKITADLIATETQFDLLKSAPCSAVGNTILSVELGELGRKLDFAETNQGIDNPEVLQLKKYYSLLQVKDYLLMQELSNKCDITADSLLYFYSDDCKECDKQGYALTEFKKRYPELRIYSFDSDLDFSVIETFASLYDFEDVYPTVIAHDKTYQGFIGLSELEELFPNLKEEQKQKELVQEGTLYILQNNETQGVTEEDISFVNETDDIYTYTVDQGDDEVLVMIMYNVLTKKFSEFKKPTAKKSV